MFFSEEKNQKTFISGARGAMGDASLTGFRGFLRPSAVSIRERRRKSLLLLFFRIEGLA